MTDPTLSPATAHSPGPLDPAITAALRDLVSDGTLDEAQAATVAERLGRATAARCRLSNVV
jgi:hypothetical protein